MLHQVYTADAYKWKIFSEDCLVQSIIRGNSHKETLSTPKIGIENCYRFPMIENLPVAGENDACPFTHLTLENTLEYILQLE